MEYVMSFIEELGYERAKYLVKHPNYKDQRDDLILRKYLIVDVSAKNIANESKSLVSAGKLILGDGDDKIEIKNDETLLTEGYGAFLEEVNPKLSKKTKLVYKIPADYADKTIIWDAFGSSKFIKLQ